MNLDLDFIRSQYPLFSNPETANWAMFENAGGSYVPVQVTDRLHDFFRFTKVQPYGPFESSIVAGKAMDEGYSIIAGLLNCDPDELTMGPSTSMNTYVLAQAVRPTLQPGDEIVVTNQDHEANIGCWRRLADQLLENELFGHTKVAFTGADKDRKGFFLSAPPVRS